ncbi:MAG: EF-hand domain-containing protein, partial [Deltaproteobacteria bacterium]|nr:EF-hand domain-containing protein [Deltaproteobacteria bacterium]
MKKYKTLILILGTVLVSSTGYRALAKPIEDISGEVLQKISVDELSSPMSREEVARRALEKKVNTGLNRMDANKDGKISHDEFMAPHEKRFKEDDINNDGFLNKDELRKAWTEHMKRKG